MHTLACFLGDSMQVKEITTAIEKLIFGKYIRKIRLSYRKLRDLHSTSNASCASDMWHRESHQSPKLTFIPKLSRSQNNQSEPCAPLWTGLQWSELKKKRGKRIVPEFSGIVSGHLVHFLRRGWGSHFAETWQSCALSLLAKEFQLNQTRFMIL